MSCFPDASLPPCHYEWIDEPVRCKDSFPIFFPGAPFRVRYGCDLRRRKPWIPFNRKLPPVLQFPIRESSASLQPFAYLRRLSSSKPFPVAPSVSLPGTKSFSPTPSVASPTKRLRRQSSRT